MLLTYCWVQSGIPRYGIGTNIYPPMVRPLNGLFEQIAAAGGVSAMYYGREPLRDAARPGSLRFAGYLNAYAEDVTIPMFFLGKRFAAGEALEGVSILDLTPTIADILNVNPAPGWEGKSPAESVFPSKISFCTLRRLHGFPGRYFCHNSMNTFHFPVGDGDISRKFLSYSAE